MLSLRVITIFSRNQSESTRRAKMRIFVLLCRYWIVSLTQLFKKNNPLHYKNSLFSHVILTTDYDFFQKSIRECAKGKNADIRLLCRYFMVSLTQLFNKRILCITKIPYFHMLFLREITIFARNQSENTRREKKRLYFCYADIGWSVLRNYSKKESFASQKFPIFTCYT